MSRDAGAVFRYLSRAVSGKPGCCTRRVPTVWDDEVFFRTLRDLVLWFWVLMALSLQCFSVAARLSAVSHVSSFKLQPHGLCPCAPENSKPRELQLQAFSRTGGE